MTCNGDYGFANGLHSAHRTLDLCKISLLEMELLSIRMEPFQPKMLDVMHREESRRGISSLKKQGER